LLDYTDSLEKEARYRLAMGQLLEQTKDYDSAIKCYSEAIALEPADQTTWYFIHNNLGFLFKPFCQVGAGLT